MKRYSILIILLIISILSFSQQTIKVRKSKTIEGYYQLQTDNKSKEFIYFDKKGNVALVTATKRKKAKGNLISCIENNNCQTAFKNTYTLKELEVSFSFNRGKGDKIHFIEFEGQFSSDGLLLTLKKGETGKMIEVKEFRRLK